MKKKIANKSSVKDKEAFKEVDALLSNIVKRPLTKAEQGAAYVGLAEVYLDSVNAILNEYKNALEATIKSLEAINTIEASFNEKLSLAKIRASLKS